MRRLLVIASVIVAGLAGPARAEVGDPVAVRRVGPESIRVETMWNLSVVIAPRAGEIGNDRSELIVRHGAADDAPDAGRDDDISALLSGVPLDVVIDRLPNAPRVSRVFGAGEHVSLSANSVRVRWFDDGYFLIQADGVRIAVVVDGLGEDMGGVDVVIGPSAVYEDLEPLATRYFVPLDADGETLEGRRSLGDTMAVSASTAPRGDGEPMVVHLKPTPWVEPEHLSALFDEKEAAARASMAVFAPMSVAQMNHAPANGTHTPRWNVEHMTGTELAFFSGVYARLDPEMRPITRSPAQMPPDYVARQPTWAGAEEARQIERTQAYTRRFAYLLDGLPPDELPEGAPRFARTLEGLFGLMIRHYPEHTAHVVEKTEQPDWPR